jgi:hypothetical protein
MRGISRAYRHDRSEPLTSTGATLGSSRSLSLEETTISAPEPPEIEPDEIAAALAGAWSDDLRASQQAYALEALARNIAGPGVTPLLPEPLVDAAFEALAARPGTRMLFEAASRICAPRLVPRMEALAARREAEGDHTSKLVAQVGELTPAELFRIDGEGDDDTYAVLLTRPRQKHAQLMLISRDRRLPRLPLRFGELTQPLSPSKVEGIFRDMRAERDIPVPADLNDVPAWLADGARSSIEFALPPSPPCGELAIQLLRMLDEPELADGLSRLYPLDVDYDEDVEPGEDELDGLLADAEDVADAFAGWLRETAPGLGDDAIDLAREDAWLAFEFRANYLATGADAGWTDEELDAFLLSYVPRKVMTSEEDRSRIPDSLARLFAFLGERGDLIPPMAEKLSRRASALAETFARRAGDRTRQGPAGALLATMAAEGVEIGDRDAMQAWIAAFNERPFDERDAILGPALPPVPDDPQGGRG